MSQVTATAVTISAGTTIGGVIHANSFSFIFPLYEKKARRSRASSFQNGRLFLPLIGFLVAVLAIALSLLRGRLVVALRRGLRGFEPPWFGLFIRKTFV
jgi:hypothetical protein